MPFFISRQQVAIAIEAAEGVAETLAAGDVIAPVYDVEWSPTVEMYEREHQHSSFSSIPQIPGERYATISFATELKGSGSLGVAPPNLSASLQACGVSETVLAGNRVTYEPITEDIPSATIAVYEGNETTGFKKKMIHGARGTWTMEATKGLPVLMRFEFTGIYNEPTDTTAFTSPADTVKPEPFLSTTFIYSVAGSSNKKLESFTMDMGNEVVLRNDTAQATGNVSAAIVNRNTTATMDPEEMSVATFNVWNAWTTAPDSGMQWLLGSGYDGNTITFAAGEPQIVNVTSEDRDGIVVVSCDLNLTKSTAAGNDTWSMIFQ